MKIKKILDEINSTSSTKEKISILEKNKDNELLKKVLKMTYDKIKYKYYIKKIPKYCSSNKNSSSTLNISLEYIESYLCTRKYTGQAAINILKHELESLEKDDAIVLERVITRDLKVGINTKLINKVYKNLINETPYMRCDVYSNKTASKIKFPAIIQEKCDGRFCYAYKKNSHIEFFSRSGETQDFPNIASSIKTFPDGIYVGELLVKDSNSNLSRQEGNGLINSLNPPHEKIYFTVWDYIQENEFNNEKNKNRTPYIERFKALKNIIETNKNHLYIELINFKEVNNLNEALNFVSNIMSSGGEGGVLKDYNNIFLSGTSKTQLKLKLQIDAEMRCTGFTEGTGKRKKTFGAMTFQNDEGTIKGKTSGFTDKQLKEISENKESYIGKIITVTFNDIIKAENNDYYALSHPRFKEFRNDKDETDTLKRVQELKNMAIELS